MPNMGRNSLLRKYRANKLALKALQRTKMVFSFAGPVRQNSPQEGHDHNGGGAYACNNSNLDAVKAQVVQVQVEIGQNNSKYPKIHKIMER